MDKCPNCGANLLPGAPRCTYCDHLVPQKPAPQQTVPKPPPRAAGGVGFGGPSPQGGFGAPPPPVARPPYAQGMIGFRPPPPPPGPTPNFMLWAILGMVQFFICQLAIPGLIGAIMAFSAKSEWERGAYDSSLAKLRTTKILVIVSFVLALMVVFFYVLFMVVGAVAAS